MYLTAVQVGEPLFITLEQLAGKDDSRTWTGRDRFGRRVEEANRTDRFCVILCIEERTKPSTKPPDECCQQTSS